ncbi:hypothetical protein NC651_025773 [Populus alba x Populus x berolinensis]|nr:hypothetical protein NC651_025773 [Populus alba x Populus x berolinensis]
MARQANAHILENGWGALVVVVATLLQTSFLLHLAVPLFNHGLSSENAFNTNHSSSITFSIEFGSKKSPEFLSESVLLLGAFSFVLSVSESSKTVCLDLLCRLLEDEYRLVSPFGRVIPDVLGGIGHALCSSVVVHNVGILNALLGIWGKEDGLTILHLADWVISAGVLRASNRSPPSGQGLLIISILSVSAEIHLVSFGSEWFSVFPTFSAYIPCFSIINRAVSLRRRGNYWCGVFCNRHISVDGEDNAIVENMVRRFCQELYSGHRQVAFLLHGKADVLLEDIYKIAEPVFLMVVVFAMAVTMQKLNSKSQLKVRKNGSVAATVIHKDTKVSHKEWLH